VLGHHIPCDMGDMTAWHGPASALQPMLSTCILVRNRGCKQVQYGCHGAAAAAGLLRLCCSPESTGSFRQLDADVCFWMGWMCDVRGPTSWVPLLASERGNPLMTPWSRSINYIH